MSYDPAAVPRAIAEACRERAKQIRQAFKEQVDAPLPRVFLPASLMQRAFDLDEQALIWDLTCERLAKTSGAAPCRASFDLGPCTFECQLPKGHGGEHGLAPDPRDQRIAELKRELAGAKDTTASWDDGYARAIVDTEAERDAARAEVAELRAEVAELRRHRDASARNANEQCDRANALEAQLATARREALAWVLRECARAKAAPTWTDAEQLYALVNRAIEIGTLATPPATEGT